MTTDVDKQNSIPDFKKHGTNQFDLLEHAHIWRRGDYFLLTVGENGEALWNAARKEIER